MSEDCYGTLQTRKTERTCVTASTSSLNGKSDAARAIGIAPCNDEDKVLIKKIVFVEKL